ncbi:MAG: TetR/AcrR family transcriptional regulator [Pseudomonadota bacterium]
MNRPRGRPARGQGVTVDAILDAALSLLDEEGEQGLSMRAVAARIQVTPMSLYHHVADRAALLVALSGKIYGGVLEGECDGAPPQEALRALLLRYHEAVARHPALTLAIFGEPAAFAGTTVRITERLEALLSTLTPQLQLWRDILVDHAHGSGLALAAARDDADYAATRQGQYAEALDLLLAALHASGNTR